MDLTQLVTKTLDRRSRTGAPQRIVQAGHPALRARARDAYGVLPTALLLELIEAMTVTMRSAPGVGLAAPQIGIPLRLFVMEDRSFEDGEPADAEDDLLERRPVPLRAFLDPSYESVEEDGPETVYAWEGCLSVDDWRSIVPRPRSIVFQGLEVDGRGDIAQVREQHRGWPARILQHETDHLAGTLCHDLSVPRSFVQARYVERYADMPDAVRRLGLQGEITRLGRGEAVVRGR